MTALRCLLLGLGLGGCASTSGREWLDSPIDARGPSPESTPAFAEAPATAASRPRLRQTVTLGESYDVASEPSAAPVGGPAVQVNVHTQVPVIINNPVGYGYGYGGYGAPYGYGAGAFAAPVRASARSAPPQVGADFPAPPDYGPRALK